MTVQDEKAAVPCPDSASSLQFLCCGAENVAGGIPKYFENVSDWDS